MAARTVTCPECAKVVPYGRLSCPECGSLLASVVGSERRVDPALRTYDAGDATAAGWPSEQPITAPPPPAPPVMPDLPAPPRSRSAGTRPRTPATAMTAADVLGASPVPAGPMPRTAAPRRTARTDVPLTATPRPALAPSMSQSVETSDEPGWPSQDQPPISSRATPRAAGERPRAARRSVAQPVAQPTNGAAGHPSPGYGDGPPLPTWPPQPAGEPLPPSAAFAGAPDADVDSVPRRGSVAAGIRRSPSSSRGSTSPRDLLMPLLEQLQIDMPDNLSDWLIAAGSGVAILGFLLPWSDAVVGAKGFGGYTDNWGLASPSHVLVLLLACAMLTLAVMPNRIPAWIRSGVLGVLTAGLLIGLVWPYLIAGMGAGLGVMGEAVAAILLVAGGVVAYRDDRHDGAPDTV